MQLAAIENPRSRQEELGQVLTATPVADFMASTSDSGRVATLSTLKKREGTLIQIVKILVA